MNRSVSLFALAGTVGVAAVFLAPRPAPKPLPVPAAPDVITMHEPQEINRTLVQNSYARTCVAHDVLAGRVAAADGVAVYRALNDRTPFAELAVPGLSADPDERARWQFRRVVVACACEEFRRFECCSPAMLAGLEAGLDRELSDLAAAGPVPAPPPRYLADVLARAADRTAVAVVP